MKKPQPLSRVFDHIFRDPRMRQYFNEGRVLTAWPQVVGARVASVSRPTQLKDGVLYVRVQSAAWRNELSMLRVRIIQQLNDAVGENVVTAIVLR